MIDQKMNDWLLISGAIFIISVVVGILTVILVWKKKKEETYKDPNYHALYIMGIAFTIIGLGSMAISSLMDYSFITTSPILIIGIVYFIIGQTHRDTRRKN